MAANKTVDAITYREQMNKPWEVKVVPEGLVYGTVEFVKDWAGKPAQGGKKLDDGKTRIDLVDAEFLEGLGDVLAFGAQKYDAHNWRGGIAFSRLLGAAYRHLGAINKGEDIDGESKRPHVYHLACCVMFLSWMMKHRPDLDDRYKSDT